MHAKTGAAPEHHIVLAGAECSGCVPQQRINRGLAVKSRVNDHAANFEQQPAMEPRTP
jgi:hypothetical protein